MKKTILFLSCAFCFSASNAQVNLGFEAWTSTDPDNWTTSNQISAIGGPTTVTQETASPGTGLISAKLEVLACIPCGLFSLPDPFPGLMVQLDSSTMRPAMISFKWKGNIAVGDTGLIGAAVTLVAAQVGDAYFNVMPGTNQPTWTVTSVPFTYANSNIPDTMKIGAMTDQYLLFGGTGTTSASTILYVDDFILSGTVGINTILETNNNLILAYPNPASTVVNFNLLGTDASVLEVMDVTGKMVYSENNIQLKHSLNVSGYENGSYIVRFFNDKKEYIGTNRFNVVK